MRIIPSIDGLEPRTIISSTLDRIMLELFELDNKITFSYHAKWGAGWTVDMPIGQYIIGTVHNNKDVDLVKLNFPDGYEIIYSLPTETTRSHANAETLEQQRARWQERHVPSFKNPPPPPPVRRRNDKPVCRPEGIRIDTPRDILMLSAVQGFLVLALLGLIVIGWYIYNLQNPTP